MERGGACSGTSTDSYTRGRSLQRGAEVWCDSANRAPERLREIKEARGSSSLAAEFEAARVGDSRRQARLGNQAALQLDRRSLGAGACPSEVWPVQAAARRAGDRPAAARGPLRWRRGDPSGGGVETIWRQRRVPSGGGGGSRRGGGGGCLGMQRRQL
jgi:hypothetical protein